MTPSSSLQGSKALEENDRYLIVKENSTELICAQCHSKIIDWLLSPRLVIGGSRSIYLHIRETIAKIVEESGKVKKSEVLQ